jgi:hypothetical protein
MTTRIYTDGNCYKKVAGVLYCAALDGYEGNVIEDSWVEVDFARIGPFERREADFMFTRLDDEATVAV